MTQLPRSERKTAREICAPACEPACDFDLAFVSKTLKTIPEIQEIYVSYDTTTSVSVLVVVPEKDFSVERAIYDKQLEIIDACPDVKFNMRVISLRGRSLSEVVAPLGEAVFRRTA
jgi:hypothetical protein